MQSRRSFIVSGATTVLAMLLAAGAKAKDYHNKDVLLPLLRRVVPVSYPTDVKIGRILSDYQSMVGVDGRTRRTKTGPNRGPDFSGDVGDPVVAAASGQAAYRWAKYGGHTVDLFHSAKFLFEPEPGNASLVIPLTIVSIYSHLDTSFVDVGEFHADTGKFKWVNRGEQIGTVGYSGKGGNRRYPHVSFSVGTKGPDDRWGTWSYFNPHLLWVDGPGKITPFIESRSYDGWRLVFTAPTLPVSR